MRSLVIYATRSGNTERVAGAIAEALRARGEVELLSSEATPAPLPRDVDLIVVGGPTESHGATDAILGLFERLESLEHGGLEGCAAAAFDTRMRWPRVLSGSAAVRIGARLRKSGAALVVEPESFFVQGREPRLESGELERAATWATALGERAERTLTAASPA